MISGGALMLRRSAKPSFEAWFCAQIKPEALETLLPRPPPESEERFAESVRLVEIGETPGVRQLLQMEIRSSSGFLL